MQTLRFISLLVTALSRGPSFAHVLEAPPRLMKWSSELWREATVFNGQYQMFGLLGGPLDGAAVVITAGAGKSVTWSSPHSSFSVSAR